MNPFAGRLEDGELEEAERLHRERKAAQAEQEREAREAAEAVPVIEITFDVDDGGTVRRVAYEHLFGPRAAEHYKPGRKVSAWIDPADPGAICPGR